MWRVFRFLFFVLILLCSISAVPTLAQQPPCNPDAYTNQLNQTVPPGPAELDIDHNSTIDVIDFTLCWQLWDDWRTQNNVPPGIPAGDAGSYTPPPLSPTSVPYAPPCVSSFGFSVGLTLQITPGLPNRLRALPTTSGRFLGNIPPGGAFSILAGPTCADGYVWWQVTYQGITGWTVEGASEAWMEEVDDYVYIEPLTAIGAWLRTQTGHIACAVFAVPNDVFNRVESSIAWFEASDGTQINAGAYGVGSDLESQFNVSTPYETTLYGVCIQTRFLILNPDIVLTYGGQMSDPNHWHLTLP